ncbi:unnamed protein product [Caenorhabditis nigoni]
MFAQKNLAVSKSKKIFTVQNCSPQGTIFRVTEASRTKEDRKILGVEDYRDDQEKPFIFHKEKEPGFKSSPPSSKNVGPPEIAKPSASSEIILLSSREFSSFRASLKLNHQELYPNTCLGSRTRSFSIQHRESNSAITQVNLRIRRSRMSRRRHRSNARRMSYRFSCLRSHFNRNRPILFHSRIFLAFPQILQRIFLLNTVYYSSLLSNRLLLWINRFIPRNETMRNAAREYSKSPSRGMMLKCRAFVEKVSSNTDQDPGAVHRRSDELSYRDYQGNLFFCCLEKRNVEALPLTSTRSALKFLNSRSSPRTSSPSFELSKQEVSATLLKFQKDVLSFSMFVLTSQPKSNHHMSNGFSPSKICFA